MRIIVEAAADSKIGTRGAVRVELMRPGLPTVFDERATIIVPEPQGEPEEKRMALPEFKVVPVDRGDRRWETLLGWTDDTSSYASSAVMESGVLTVYYSTEFPKYVEPLRGFERHDVNLASSFRNRYETWLAVHSLILWQDHQLAKIPRDVIEGDSKSGQDDPESAERQERFERVRIATMASLFAAREVKLGGTADNDTADGSG